MISRVSMKDRLKDASKKYDVAVWLLWGYKTKLNQERTLNYCSYFYDYFEFAYSDFSDDKEELLKKAENEGYKFKEVFSTTEKKDEYRISTTYKGYKVFEKDGKKYYEPMIMLITEKTEKGIQKDIDDVVKDYQ